MENRNTTAAVVAADEKHVQLDSSIHEMNSVIEHAKSILTKIRGEDSAVLDSNVDKCCPSLSEMLNRAPGIIRDRNAELHDILNEISDSLF